MTLDGYLAGKDDDLSFLDGMQLEGEDYGYSDFVDSVDAVIVGRKTYEKVLDMGYEYPHTDKEVYIITRSPKRAKGSFQYYTGDLSDLIEKLKSEEGKNIYCDGGAEIVRLMLEKNLIDDIILSVVPVLLGDGIKLFKEGFSGLSLDLIDSKSFQTGLVQLHYKCKS